MLPSSQQLRYSDNILEQHPTTTPSITSLQHQSNEPLATSAHAFLHGSRPTHMWTLRFERLHGSCTETLQSHHLPIGTGLDRSHASWHRQRRCDWLIDFRAWPLSLDRREHAPSVVWRGSWLGWFERPQACTNTCSVAAVLIVTYKRGPCAKEGKPEMYSVLTVTMTCLLGSSQAK
jgi:hypothetical protein